MPLALSDAELQIVMSAARPLLPPDRDRFLLAVAELGKLPAMELGPGNVGRVVRTMQPQFFAAPTFRGNLHLGKYGR